MSARKTTGSRVGLPRFPRRKLACRSQRLCAGADGSALEGALGRRRFLLRRPERKESCDGHWSLTKRDAPNGFPLVPAAALCCPDADWRAELRLADQRHPTGAQRPRLPAGGDGLPELLREPVGRRRATRSEERRVGKDGRARWWPH